MNLLIILLLLAMNLAFDALIVFTPWLMPETECLTVTVPHGERQKEPLRGLMRAYAVHTAIASALCLLVWPIALGPFGMDLSTDRGVAIFSLLLTFSLCAPILASFVWMLRYRRLVQQVKREKGWVADSQRSAAVMGPDDFPQPISVYWNITYLPLIAVMVAFALLNYDRFPDQIPMSINFNGVVESYAPKSVASVLFPAIVAAFLGVVFAATHVGIVQSKKPIDPSIPASTALAYGRFARIQSIVMLAGGLVLSATTGAVFYASSLGVLPLSSAALVEMVVTLLFAVVMLALSIRLGQAGGRIVAEAPEGSMARDDDAYWKLGVFYCNPDEPSIFVPKRFGVGWTVNIGRRETWLIIVGFVVLTVGFTWGISAAVS